ncbi:hypothetical protein EIL87_16150 [Saccharopolyspora rhizosphaerae]|uniref:MFS transporter n=1 Tax=Saccharopolyspora rhizosphaerae TaxID=2492662 RepID=A0A3R8VDX0_9PSEU|nr:hypothetical protein [Saccharopolyspora rhizosphaerae]RRO15561.1 hypothetical protein EIL87_16150 [Saccharopolyspora rhizosphaerae]
MSRADAAVFGFLLLNTVLLAILELLYLPLYIGSVQFPISAAVAAVTTPLLVAEAGRISRSRRVAGAPLVLWFAVVLVFGVFGPGGDVVLLGSDWRTLLLIGGGALPSAMMLGMVLAKPGR